MSTFLDFNNADRLGGDPGPEQFNSGIDRDEVADRLLSQLESVMGYLYPGGFADPKGKKFYIGSVHGEEGESLSVELSGQKAGLWHDFATGDGGDIFDLWKEARGLSSFRETLQDAAEYTGAALNVPRRTPKRKSPTGGEAWGTASATYRYTDAAGKILAEVERFDWEKNGESKKTFRPWDVSTRSYKAPETRPLYNLPNIAKAPEIVVVEGEKAADALIGQNIDATTAMGGASAPIEKTDWSIVKGRKVVIWPDNDEPGKAYAERLKIHLENEGALAVSILSIPSSRPTKWDAADAEGEDLGAILRSMRSVSGAIMERQSQFFGVDTLHGITPPAREWLVEGLIPENQVTMLGGDGGVGKSLLAIQLAMAAASGCDWVGNPVKQGNTIYISAEDDKDELHRRVAAISEGSGIDLATLPNLIMRSLAGEDALLAIADARSSTLQTTELFAELNQFIQQSQARLLVLDTLADLHSGQENDRTVARQFIGLLRGMALRNSCTILLLAHPSLTGISSGSGLSGSTAWNNSVRSRLYFERVLEDGEELDTDVRKMSTKKANYGKTGNEIFVKWEEGMFVPDSRSDSQNGLSSDGFTRGAFMELLDKYRQEGRRVNASGGPNYAPNVMSKDPRSGRFSKTALAAAMNDLFEIGTIKTAPYGPPSRGTNEIVRNR